MGKRVEIWVALAVGLWLSAGLEAQLQVGFYDDTCPVAEAIVFGAVSGGLIGDVGVAAGLVRMHFHDCFIRVSLAFTLYSLFTLSISFMLTHLMERER